jgi:hypothetical protein
MANNSDTTVVIMYRGVIHGGSSFEMAIGIIEGPVEAATPKSME